MLACHNFLLLSSCSALIALKWDISPFCNLIHADWLTGLASFGEFLKAVFRGGSKKQAECDDLAYCFTNGTVVAQKRDMGETAKRVCVCVYVSCWWHPLSPEVDSIVIQTPLIYGHSQTHTHTQARICTRYFNRSTLLYRDSTHTCT